MLTGSDSCYCSKEDHRGQECMAVWNRPYEWELKRHSLYGELLDASRLKEAAKKVKSNRGSAGLDGMTISQFEEQEEKHLQTLLRRLRNKEYQPQPVLRKEIEKPGTSKKRKLGIPRVLDRVVQGVVKEVLEPIWECEFSDNSFGYRPGRNAHDAVKMVEKYRVDHPYVSEVDIKEFFDNVDHDVLLDLLNERVSDGSVLGLIRMFLEAGVMIDGKVLDTDVGTPQGGIVSPLLANIYLNHLDRKLEEMGYCFVRYADDLLILCKTQEDAEKALVYARSILENDLKLRLNLEKTRICHIADNGRDPFQRNYDWDGFIEFLGFRINQRYAIPSVKSIERFKEKIRSKTARSHPRPLAEIVLDCNRIIEGWGRYFAIGQPGPVFHELDAFVRLRLRCNLHRRKWRSFRLNKDWFRIICWYYPIWWFLKKGLALLVSLVDESPFPCAEETRDFWGYLAKRPPILRSLPESSKG